MEGKGCFPIGRSCQQKTARLSVGIYTALDRQRELGRALHLVDRHLLRQVAYEALRIGEGKIQISFVIQADIVPSGLAMPRQGGLPALQSSADCNMKQRLIARWRPGEL